MKHRLDRFHAQKYWKHRSSHEWNRDPRTSATRCGTDNSRKFPRGAAECGGRGLGGVKLRMYRGAAYANENKWRNWAHSHTANTEHGRTAGPRHMLLSSWGSARTPYELTNVAKYPLLNISKKRYVNSWQKILTWVLEIHDFLHILMFLRLWGKYFLWKPEIFSLPSSFLREI